HQVALDEPKFFNGTRPLGRREWDPEAGQSPAIEHQLWTGAANGLVRFGRRQRMFHTNCGGRRRNGLTGLPLTQQRRCPLDQPYRLCHYVTPTEWSPKLNASNVPYTAINTSALAQAPTS